MSLAGKGAVTIWHDIAPGGRPEFYRWHGIEHMPERAAIPGFLRGRRYLSVDGSSPEYFNLYETQSAATLTGSDYLARLNHPTAWTVDTVKHFRGVSRSLCRVHATFGEGQGGLIATFRYAVDTLLAAAHQQRMLEVALPGFCRLPDIAGAHLLVADQAASEIETAEKKVRPERNAVPGWIVLIEGWGDIEPFAALCGSIARDGVFADASAPLVNVYRLQNSRELSAAGST